MQVKNDSLQKQLAETYKPGFGEFMCIMPSFGLRVKIKTGR
jgi:hypothetical protein